MISLAFDAVPHGGAKCTNKACFSLSVLNKTSIPAGVARSMLITLHWGLSLLPLQSTPGLSHRRLQKHMAGVAT
eukprot:7481483-Karenia_brevis.AAC.1